MSAPPRYAVVIPTVGRRCLRECLSALAASAGPAPNEIVLVDDRRPEVGAQELPLEALGALRDRVLVLRTGGRGPAAARNAGWRAASATEWIAFLDDDVRVRPDWRTALAEDLGAAGARVGAVQGRLEVPLPADRPPTDWERCTAGLADARWATADMAYRRAALAAVGGFDERFRRAFREDADLALRVARHGWSLAVGRRRTVHPVRAADAWVSLRAQAGNADDALMVAVHGPSWWHHAGAPRGRIRRHLAVTAAGAAAVLAGLGGRRGAAVLAGALWLAGTAEFARARIAPGPRDRREVGTMLVTSVLIPPTAAYHRLRGTLRHRRAPAWEAVS